MKNVLLLLFAISIGLTSCQKDYLQEKFVNEITYEITRSDVEGTYEGRSEALNYFITPYLFRPQNVPNKRLLQAYFTLGAEEVDMPFAFATLDIIFAIPLADLQAQNTPLHGWKLKPNVEWKDIVEAQGQGENLEVTADFNDDNISARARLDQNGTTGIVDIKLKKMRRFTDKSGKPKAYLKGTFKLNATARLNPAIVFEMKGTFKIVIDLVFD